jgi:magnesium transporter
MGDTEPKDLLTVIWKEIRVAALCGISLAAVNFFKMLLVDKMLLGNAGVTPLVAFTVSLTLVFVIIFAKVVGSTLPLAAEKIGIDPAVMASPLISTVTDTVSLIIYFTLATLLLHI